MSLPNKTNVSCPQCGASFTTTVWSSVNTDLSDDLASKIISGDFFDAKCPKCGFTAHMEYDLLYHDMKHHAMIWVLHNENEKYLDKRVEIKSTKMLPGYQTRIVKDMNELREKVSALESGKDDRIVELCKVFIKYEVKRQNPQFTPRNVFYTYANDEDIMFIYDVDGNEMHCRLERELYNTIKESFSDVLALSKAEPYSIYDIEWATSFFSQHSQSGEEKKIAPVLGQTDIEKELDQIVVPIKKYEADLAEASGINLSASENVNTGSPPPTAYLALVKNPFYILNVTCSDNRRAIMSASDEMSFLNDADLCNESAGILSSPAKRLSAEIDWFIEANRETLQEIRSCIDSKHPIPTERLASLSKLNASLYNFALSQDDDYLEMGYSILDIDEQYSAIDIGSLTKDINECRENAKMTEVTAQDVAIELGKKRNAIRQTITEKLAVLDNDSYVELVTMLAEKCLADESYDDGVILTDVVDQYEIRMQAEIEDCTAKIESHIERIKSLIHEESISSNVNSLIRRVKQWDKFVQPLQLRSKASGMPHENSVKVGHEIRSLALYLHNEKGKTEEALTLVNAMQEIFAELDDLVDFFNTDSEALEALIAEDKEAKSVMAEMEAIKDDEERLKTSATTASVEVFLARVKSLNERIKKLDVDTELCSKARENLCYMAREIAIELHNSKQQTALSLTIAKSLLNLFGDVPGLQAKLKEDMNTLNQQLIYQNANQARRVQQESAQKSKRIGCLVVVGIVVLIIIISAIANSTGSNSNSNQGSSNHPSVETAAPETKFTSSSTSGTKVYTDIMSIWPAIGIYTEGSSNYSHFVCECRTSSGSTVWIYMTITEYHNNFDSSASTSIYSSYADEVTYTTSKRIHGTVKKADNIMSDLSSDTGTMVIDFGSID